MQELDIIYFPYSKNYVPTKYLNKLKNVKIYQTMMTRPIADVTLKRVHIASDAQK